MPEPGGERPGKEINMKIVMLGAPGAGKGTQAARIALKNGTELGKKAKEYMDKGELVPDELTCEIVADRIFMDDCAKGYILDGFPRNIPQGRYLTDVLSKADQKIDFAIDVEVPDENIVKRMSGRRACPNCGATYHIVNIPPKKEGICDTCGTELIQRADDKAETVKKRLDVYHDATQPLIDYYKELGVLKTVDGTQPMNDVFEDICKILED